MQAHEWRQLALHPQPLPLVALPSPALLLALPLLPPSPEPSVTEASAVGRQQGHPLPSVLLHCLPFPQPLPCCPLLLPLPLPQPLSRPLAATQVAQSLRPQSHCCSCCCFPLHLHPSLPPPLQSVCEQQRPAGAGGPALIGPLLPLQPFHGLHWRWPPRAATVLEDHPARHLQRDPQSAQQQHHHHHQLTRMPVVKL